VITVVNSSSETGASFDFLNVVTSYPNYQAIIFAVIFTKSAAVLSSLYVDCSGFGDRQGGRQKDCH